MAAYYNEFEPYPAQWLRNLIAAGLIARGDVDERSIVDVKADDLKGYTQCHFFAGIGGWSYALRLAGWPDDRPVWTGSCPCQPLSCAGQRKGHVDERHLWPAFYSLIAKCRPTTIFGEQVASKDGREWFCGVRADLEETLYAVGGADLCAAGVGAPHIRQRLYWVAHANSAIEHGRSSIGKQPLCDGLHKTSARTEDSRCLPKGGGAQDMEKRKAAGHAITLQDQSQTLKGWATPRQRDYKGNGVSIARAAKGVADSLDLQCKLVCQNGMVPPSPLSARTDTGAYPLNPIHSLWLMGYSTVWASCAVPAMRSSLKSRKPS